MYKTYFGFTEKPFTIAPNPQYLFMSPRHKEALAHMLYAMQGEGGIMVLTGEVGTGKTTLCRHMLAEVPEHTDVAYIINPRQSATEMLASLCDELHIDCTDTSSIKALTDALNQHLLDNHAKGKHTVLIIDEAQQLDITVLEQLRLLTNLETNDKKLLQIMLLGQPELADVLKRKDLRQFAQRITARYHLTPLNKGEVVLYLAHRLEVAGCKERSLFPTPVIDLLYQYSGGVPRLINLIADRALLGAYASESKHVNKAIVQQAKEEVLGNIATQSAKPRPSALPYILLFISVIALLWFWNKSQVSPPQHLAKAVTQPSLHVPTTPKPTLETTTKTTAPVALQETTPHVQKVLEPQEAPPIQPMPNTASFNHAFVPVFTAWGIQYEPLSDGDACDFATQHQLQCLRQLGDIPAMRSLDKPAVLTISNDDGHRVYAAVLKLTGTNATLAAQDKYAEVPLSQLALYSHNDFTLLWKSPKGYNAPVRPGHQGELVALLAEQITQALKQSWIGAPRTKYDDTLKEQVKTLQRQQGLSPDGVAGPLTWIHINALNNIDSPRLQVSKGDN